MGLFTKKSKRHGGQAGLEFGAWNLVLNDIKTIN